MRDVLVIGAGGLGCPAATALARAGVERITLVDPDRVDVTNLHRQLLHGEGDVGRLKVESAREKLRVAFPSLQVDVRALRVDAANVEALFAEHAVVIDGVDGVETKFLLSDASVKTGVPLIYGGVLRFEGQLMHLGRGGPCLRCLFETPPEPGRAPTCAQAGVLGPVAGIIGGLQAELAVEVLGGRQPDGVLRVFDGRALRWRQLHVKRAPDCAVCSLEPQRIALMPSAAECAG